MKINLNKKGFTLVELLAVIVVLAIIMLVVANRVGDAMKSSRGNSLILQAQSIQRDMNQFCILNNQISKTDIKNKIENGNYDLYYAETSCSDSSSNACFVVKAEQGSKFANINKPDASESPVGIKLVEGEGEVYLKTPSVEITLDCPYIPEEE